MKNVLLLGAGGMLGRSWQSLLRSRGFKLILATRADCDITDPSAVGRAVTRDCDIVVNCAAYSNVDGAETKRDRADATNAVAVGVLARRCLDIDALCVHYSTDYVFNGRGRAPYSIEAPTDPINAYGAGKAAGETLLAESGCRHLLIRTSWLYAAWGENFVRTIAAIAREKPLIRVVNDQRGRPTSVVHLASATLDLVESHMTGTWHVTDGGACSWYDLARRVAGRVNERCRVEPCTSEQFPRPAPRPGYSVLDITKTQAVLGPMPHWTSNLDMVLDALNDA